MFKNCSSSGQPNTPTANFVENAKDPHRSGCEGTSSRGEGALDAELDLRGCMRSLEQESKDSLVGHAFDFVASTVSITNRKNGRTFAAVKQHGVHAGRSTEETAYEVHGRGSKAADELRQQVRMQCVKNAPVGNLR